MLISIDMDILEWTAPAMHQSLVAGNGQPGGFFFKQSDY